MALIHRWQLTENANDSVGTLHLTNNGTVTFSSDGASFNGSSQWLSGTIAVPAALSFAAWIKLNNTTSRQTPMSTVDAAGRLTGFDFARSAGLEGFYFAHNIPSGAESSGFNSANYPSTSHVLVVGTYENNAQKLYRNGTLIATGSAAPVGSASSAFSIGRFGDQTSGYLNGKIADARIYDHVLSASEVAALYAAGPNPSEAGTLVRLAQVF